MIDVHAGDAATAPLLTTVGGRAVSASSEATHVAVPSATGPRLVVPRRPRAGAAFLRGRSQGSSGTARFLHRSAAAAVRLGAVPRLMGDLVALDPRSAVLRQLQGTIPRASVPSLGIAMGPPRPNAKPVIHVLTDTGAELGYAKVGWNALTRQLVAHEGAQMQRLAGVDLPGVHIPTLIRLHEDDLHSLLVTAPLDRGRTPDRRDLDAVRVGLDGLSAVFGTRTTALGDSGWADELRMAVDAPGPLRDRLSTALAATLDRYGSESHSLGAAHRDFSPWNTGVRHDGLAVWDLERLCVDAPLGMDALHFAVRLDRGGGPWPTRVERAVREARVLWRRPTDWSVVTACYLLDQSVRHLAGDVASDGVRDETEMALTRVEDLMDR